VLGGGEGELRESGGEGLGRGVLVEGVGGGCGVEGRRERWRVGERGIG